jgi:hypothetical protein
MAEENIPKQFFHIRDISTKTVTLYPARAHIVREIAHISLQPGQNEVEIYGFATTIDEHSLQIEGLGDPSVAITDITVNQVPNKEQFEDVHEEYEEDASDLEDYEDSDDEAPSVKQAKKIHTGFKIQLEAAEEEEASAQTQLSTLDVYIASVKADHSDAKNFAESVRTYDQERQRVSAALAKAQQNTARFGKRTNRALWDLTKVQKIEKEKNRVAVKAKEKERNKKLREQQERRVEADRKRDELREFWPDNVYRVVVRLETAIDTPGPSRRSSITVAQAAPEISEKVTKSTPGSIALSISYVTSGSFWVPRYDLNISSIQKTAQITYRAEVRNGTTETWKDARVVLSTSQTSYSGLEDKVPTMQAWQVTLNRYGSNDALLSNAEISHLEIRKNVALQSHAQASSKKRSLAPSSSARPVPTQNAWAPSQVVQQQDNYVQQRMVPQAVSSSMAPPGVLGGTGESARRGRSVFGSLRKRSSVIGGDGTSTPSEEVATLFETPESAPLDFEESAWEDYGLTATYELPGTRTLEPSSLARRHKIATLNATNIILNHISVPKLRASAFLRAKIRNPSSSVTLLKGNAGITLDGSFLGNIPLPRVSPNQMFNIPLGVDPAIQISYPKPTLHRSTQGIFTKERTHVFSRSIFVSNTKPVPVELVILDQVPISQDERLRIDIIEPRGLAKEGDTIKCGQPANESKKPWGKATAALKKDGEISWTAEIEKGQACLLKFEYEAKMPSAESMANA